MELMSARMELVDARLEPVLGSLMLGILGLKPPLTRPQLPGKRMELVRARLKQQATNK